MFVIIIMLLQFLNNNSWLLQLNLLKSMESNFLQKVKDLIKEGNIRKIIISDNTGKEIMSFPLTYGVVGTLLAPVLAAIGAVAALIGECTITVEKEEKSDEF
jgi:hypothetical protein